MATQQNNLTGLSILFSIIVILFIIGLVVFVFSIFGSEVQNTTSETLQGSVVNETLLFTNGTGTDTSVANLNGVTLSNVVVVGCK